MKRMVTIISVGMMMVILSGSLLAQHGKCKMSAAQTAGETVTLKGEITNVLLPLAKLKSEDKEYTVHLGPIWYWKQENLKLENGVVEISGEKEEVKGELHFYPNKIVQGKVEIVLVSESGAPKWAGQQPGNGQHGQHGMQNCCGGCCDGGRK